jgi:hypothetical protein
MMFLSGEPYVKAVKDSYWEEDCASKKKAPSSVSKAIEDVGQPRKEATPANQITHLNTSSTGKNPMISPRMIATKNSVPDWALFSMLFISIPFKASSQNIPMFSSAQCR